MNNRLIYQTSCLLEVASWYLAIKVAIVECIDVLRYTNYLFGVSTSQYKLPAHMCTSVGRSHILFGCEGDVDICQMRSTLWGSVLQASPGVLGDELVAMGQEERVKLMLNALYGEYISEWQDLYGEMCKFVYLVYMCYYGNVK